MSFLSRPSPWAPFCVGTRLAGVALPMLALACAEGWPSLLGAWGAIGLLRVPRRRLLGEFAATHVLLAAFGYAAGLPVWPFALGVVVTVSLMALAPEKGLLPLNGIDRVLVAQERPGAPLNVFYFVDTDRPLHRKAVVQALADLMLEIDMLRSFVRESFLGMERFVAKRPWVAAEDLVLETQEPVETHHYARLERAFDLSRVPPIRVVLAPRAEGGHRFVLTSHHSATDGTGLLLIYERFMDLYNAHATGTTPPPPVPIPPAIRIRDLIKNRGIRWTWRMIRRHLHPLGKVGAKNATLLDDRLAEHTHTRFLFIDILAAKWARCKLAAQALGCTRNELVMIAALRATDAYLRARHVPERPLKFMLPMDLRSALGLNPSLQNFVGPLSPAFLPEEVRSPILPRLVSERVREYRSFEQAIEQPINVGVITLLVPPFLLRRALRKLEFDRASSFYTLFFSTPRLLKPIPLPHGVVTESMIPLASMVRRPGVGFVCFVRETKVTLGMVYLSPLIRDESVRELADTMMRELESLSFTIPAQ